MSEQIKSTFRVIEGGKGQNKIKSNKSMKFLDAYVTDTRLMGVVGMYVHWLDLNDEFEPHIHQFFSFDSEQFGFDSFESVSLSDNSQASKDSIERISTKLFSCLGGSRVQISEKEARYMVQIYAQLNIKEGLSLPQWTDQDSDYSFMLEPRIVMSDTEEYALMAKQCPILKTPYEVINYFLMRCFGKDFHAAKFLTKNYVRTDIFKEHKMATLVKNSIEEAQDDESGANSNYYLTSSDDGFQTFVTFKSYMCESVIEYDDCYYLVITKITLDKLRIVRYEKISSFRITSQEVAMLISRPEYIAVIDCTNSPILGGILDTPFASAAVVTSYEYGQLYMGFNPSNNHVRKSDYLLSEDVLGMCFCGTCNQLILCAYSPESLIFLEEEVFSSSYEQYIESVDEYYFERPVFHDFINGDFPVFEMFLETIPEENYQEIDLNI